MLVNQCSHAMDLLCWWLGMPEFVSANVGYGKWHQIEVDDDISCFARYPGGGTLHFLASTADVPGINLFEIQGDAGKLAIDRESGPLRVYRLDEPEPRSLNRLRAALAPPAVRAKSCALMPPSVAICECCKTSPPQLRAGKNRWRLR